MINGLPPKIKFPSDGTIAELKESYKDKKGCFGVYKYITGYYFKEVTIYLLDHEL